MHLDRILKHGLYEFYDRRFSRALVGREIIDIDPAFAELLFYFFRQCVDLFLAAVHAVDRVQQIGLINERESHRSFQQTAQGVVGVYVGGIGHADQQSFVVRLQHERPIAARLDLFEQEDRVRIQLRQAEIDIIDAQVPGQEPV